jgi:hypothetical protein
MDGDLTAMVTASGLSAVNTHIATPANSPYVITYSVMDAAGNMAVPRRRRVIVSNPCKRNTLDNPTPADELVCRKLGDLEAGEKSYYCSTNQLCTTFEIPQDADAVVNLLPILTLVGPSQIEIMQGEPYIKCPSGARLADVCDRGVTAVDPEEGDVVANVRACSPDGVTGIFRLKGLTYCKIDTMVPGNYPIVFEVSDASLKLVNVTRTLIVKGACSAGERLCLDMVECSVGGTCTADLSADSTVVEEVVDQPPVIRLKAHPLLGRYMSLGRNVPFAACAPGQVPTATLLCDLGANATDFEDGNLTSSIIVPTGLRTATGSHACVAFGCPDFKFVNKGIKGNLNTAAAVGTVFDITYYVFDSASPPHIVSINRTITIVSPCDFGDSYCDDGAGDKACSKLTCLAQAELRALLDTRDTTPPVVTVRWVAFGAAFGQGPPRRRLFDCVGRWACSLRRARSDSRERVLALLCTPCLSAQTNHSLGRGLAGGGAAAHYGVRRRGELEPEPVLHARRVQPSGE